MRTLLLLATFAAAAALPAGAYVEAMMPLQQVLNESEVIAEGTIEKVDPKNKTAVVRISKSLKGKCGYEQIKMTFGGGQIWHPDAIQKHLVVGAPAIIFYNAGRQAEMYLNRFFFQLYGDAAAPPEKAWWSFTHIEIRMNRTFNGSVAELSDTVQKVLAGKSKPPAPNQKLPPVGPEHVKALPAHGEPAVEEAALPPPFLKAGLARKVDAKTMHATFAVDPEGFIKQWLVLGPIAVGAQGSDQTENGQKGIFNKEWFPKWGEARPRELDKATVDGAELVWESGEAADFFLDFGLADNSLHLAVAYLVAESDLNDLTLMTGSDDSGLWRLNGKEVQRVYAGRGVGKDQERSGPVSLKKGVNVLMMAVINGGGPTAGCARFLNKAGQPVKSLRVSRSPTPAPPSPPAAPPAK